MSPTHAPKGREPSPDSNNSHSPSPTDDVVVGVPLTTPGGVAAVNVVNAAVRSPSKLQLQFGRATRNGCRFTLDLTACRTSKLVTSGASAAGVASASTALNLLTVKLLEQVGHSNVLVEEAVRRLSGTDDLVGDDDATARFATVLAGHLS